MNDEISRHNPADIERYVRQAMMTLRLYAKLVDGPGAWDTTETAMTDMISDMLHLADADGISFDEILRLSRMHHHAEVFGENCDPVK